MGNISQILSTVGIRDPKLDHVILTGHDPILPSPFLIGEAGALALALVGYAVSECWFLKTKRRQSVHIDVRDAAIAQRSHEYMKLLDRPTPDLWSPFSGFYATKDQRWIQLHCNFPHHRTGIIEFLGCQDDKAAVTQAIKKWPAELLEKELSDRGLCAAMVRTSAEWAMTEQAQAIATLPLIEIIPIGASPIEPFKTGVPDRPLSDIRVLDLTRVVAGPVCGKTLAEYGATVLAISNPHLPSIPPLVMDTGYGKLSAFLDLNQPEEKKTLFNLIDGTDIFLEAYRPGSLFDRGFSPNALAKRRPGIIYISLSAYSHEGPWANRHGYDSLVQSATGIAEENGKNGMPHHLPAQSLDYITGFLAAFGAMEALKRRARVGGSYLVRLSLAQTAHWFKQLGRVTSDFSHCAIPTREEIAPLLTQTETLFGRMEHLLPVLKLSETPPYWDKPTVPLGSHSASWP